MNLWMGRQAKQDNSRYTVLEICNRLRFGLMAGGDQHRRRDRIERDWISDEIAALELVRTAPVISPRLMPSEARGMGKQREHDRQTFIYCLRPEI
jgi:hypothetical protein